MFLSAGNVKQIGAFVYGTLVRKMNVMSVLLGVADSTARRNTLTEPLN